MKKREWIFLGVVIVILLIFVWQRKKTVKWENTDTVFIYHQNKVVKTLSLKKTGLYPIPGDVGGLTVEILNENVRVKTSKCPAKICVHKGFIHDAGDTIICAPNKIMVQVGKVKGLDGISR